MSDRAQLKRLSADVANILDVSEDRETLNQLVDLAASIIETAHVQPKFDSSLKAFLLTQ